MWQIKLKTISYFYNRRSDLNNLLHSALEAGTFTLQMWIDVLTNYYGKWNAQWFRVIRNLANWWFLQITTHCPLLHILPLPVKILISALILAILALYLLRVESIPKFLMLHSSSKYTKLLSCWKATKSMPSFSVVEHCKLNSITVQCYWSWGTTGANHFSGLAILCPLDWPILLNVE